jgi:GNAT superfamily N-acetyltransferase
MMHLAAIAPTAYARLVLPQTAALWAGRRDFDTYVANTIEIARCPYGRRHYRTIGFFEGDRLAASFKRYERTIRFDGDRLRAMGIGAVFTPPDRRGRGYATAMLAAALDQAREQGYDLAYLFSDVKPQFYAAIGFTELPSRALSLRADTLPAGRLPVAPLTESDWTGVRRCFELTAHGHAGFERTPLVWEWLRTRMRHGSEHPLGEQTHRVLRRGRAVSAYVLGVRIPTRDLYVVDEFGFAGTAAAAAIPALLRAAAGDLRRIGGWLPPRGARELLPRGSVRRRSSAIFMAAPLTPRGRGAIAYAAAAARADFCWATEHI